MIRARGQSSRTLLDEPRDAAENDVADARLTVTLSVG